MASRLRLTCFLTIALVGLVNASYAGEVSILKITAKVPVGQWAFDEETGRLFASTPSENCIIEYNAAGTESVRKFDVPGSPTQLIIKSHWLIAACPQEHLLRLINLKSNGVAGTVKLDMQEYYCLFCSKAKNAFVYVAGNQTVNGRGCEIVQIDCKSRTICKQLTLQNSRRPLPNRCAKMSADGRWLACTSNQYSPLNGVTLMKFNEENGTFKAAAQNLQAAGTIIADSSGRWWTIGNTLCSADMSSKPRRFQGVLTAIHPSRNLTASVSEDETLILQAFSDDTSLQRIKLAGDESSEDATSGVYRPGAVIRNGRVFRGNFGQNGLATNEPLLTFDASHDRLIFAAADKAYIVDLAPTIEQYSKRLVIGGLAGLDTTVGQPRRIALSMADGGKATWAIESAPSFVKLEGNELVITPTVENLGRHEVEIKANRGDLSDKVKLSCDIGVPSIDVGFRIEQMVLDATGSTALAWGKKAGLRQNTMNAGDGAEPTEIALVDLELQKLISSQSISSDIHLGCLDEKYVYLAMITGDVLYRIERADFSKRTRIFLNQSPGSMECLPSGQLAVKLSNFALGSVVVYDRETMTRNVKHFADSNPGPGFNPSTLVSSALSDHLQGNAVGYRDQFVDSTTSEFLSATDAIPLPALADAPSFENRHVVHFFARKPVWARALNGDTLTNQSGAQIANLHGPTAISPYLPLAASLRGEINNNRSRQVLAFHEIKLGEIIQSVTLNESDSSDFAEYRANLYEHSPRVVPASPVQFTKDKVVCRTGSQIYICPISEEVRKKTAIPLCFKIPKTPIAKVESPVEVQLATLGGEGRPTFALTKQYEGVSIDSASGKLAVDLPKIWKKVIEAGRTLVPSTNSPYIAVQNLPDGATLFERVVGSRMPVDRLAFKLPIAVEVSNDAGEADNLQFALVVTAPKDEYNIAVAKHASFQTVENELLKGTGNVRGASLPRADESQRIVELETRIRRIEASVDAVLQKLDRLENDRQKVKPTTTPDK